MIVVVCYVRFLHNFVFKNPISVTLTFDLEYQGHILFHMVDNVGGTSLQPIVCEIS